MKLPQETELRSTTIVVVDDDHAFAEGLRLLLEAEGFRVVASAANGVEAVNATARTRPWFVLMDLDMPEMDGVAATKLIRRWWPDTTVIAVSGANDALLAARAEGAGAAAIVSKTDIASRLLELLRGAAAVVGTPAGRSTTRTRPRPAGAKPLDG